MKVGEFNAETGEQIIRDATPDEIAARKAEVAQALAEKAARKAAEEELRATKISAYEKLGLSAQEIEALVPTPKPPRFSSE